MSKWLNFSNLLSVIAMLGALYVYLEGNSTQSAVLQNTVGTLKVDVDELEKSLSNVPTTLARMEEKLIYIQRDIEELKAEQ